MLKRKEREFEHEMERLAKEKIAKQQQIIILRRELSAHIDNYDSTSILTDGEVGNGIRERGSYQFKIFSFHSDVCFFFLHVSPFSSLCNELRQSVYSM